MYSEAGKKQTGEQIAYYMKNAKYIFDGLKNAGYSVSGGVNAPYIWLKTPDGGEEIGGAENREGERTRRE